MSRLVITATTIRFLILAEVVLMVAGITAAMLSDLPPALQQWNEAQAQVDPLSSPLVSFLFTGLVAASFIGVLLLKTWGRTLYTLLAVGSLALMLVQDAGVYTRWTGLLSDLGQAITWFLIALMYFSDARVFFERTPLRS